MNFGRLGLLIIKGFENVNEINHYLKVMNSSTQLELPLQVRPVVISVKNFDTLLRGGGSFDEYFKYMRDKTYEDTQERVLPSEFFEHEPPGVRPEGYEDETSDADTPATEPEPEVTVEPSEADDSEPEVKPDVMPEPQPESKPEPKPEVEPEQKQEPEPEQQPKPESAPAPEKPTATPLPEKPKPEAPRAKPVPTPATPAPALPDYPEGSEGDDPLLD